MLMMLMIRTVSAYFFRRSSALAQRAKRVESMRLLPITRPPSIAHGVPSEYEVAVVS